MFQGGRGQAHRVQDERCHRRGEGVLGQVHPTKHQPQSILRPAGKAQEEYPQEQQLNISKLTSLSSKHV